MKIFKPFNLYELEFERLNFDLEINEQITEKRLEFNELISQTNTAPKYFSKTLDQVVYSQLSKYSSIGTSTIEGLFSGTDNMELVEIESKLLGKENIDNEIVVSRIRNRLERRNKIDLDNFEEYVINIHNEIFEGIPKYKSGKFKKKQNFINKNGTNIIKLFSPKDVEKELLNLSKFIKKEFNRMHKVELAAILHAYFIAIHPFSDGNGRVGRIVLAEFFNLSIGHPLYLDEVFNLTVKQYVGVMNDFSENKSFKRLFSYFAQSTVDQLNRNIGIVQDVIKQEELLLKILNKSSIRNKYFDGIVSYLILNNYLSIPRLSNELSIDRRTTKTIVDSLVKIKLIKETKIGSKTKIYQIIKEG